MNADESSKPECDLVMKGGVTSGVIYARLARRLAKRYMLRSIGGTSAGAIAAAMTAAAQLGETSGSNCRAFEQLDGLPTELGAQSSVARGTRLQDLFQPHPTLAGHFKVLLALIDSGSTIWRISHGLVRMVWEFRPGAAIGALPGLIAVALNWQADRPLAAMVAGAIALLGALVGALTIAILDFGRELPRSGFGLCSGMSNAGQPAKLAITPWLHERLQSLSGAGCGPPLTFGELWAGRLRDSAGELKEIPEADRRIVLAMITTALNHGRPYRLPFELKGIYFVPAELEAYLPSDVIDWMKLKRRKSATAEQLSKALDLEVFALPEPKNFPVVAAVRLSFGVPLLVSAIPLYVVDWTLEENRDKEAGVKRATRILFSDGGVCSNFPMHFFDSPVPSRPTFGVFLEVLDEDAAKGGQGPAPMVRMPQWLNEDHRINRHFPSMDHLTGLSGVVGFTMAVFRTMRSWHDEAQIGMPGFRDRIVTVYRRGNEGGMSIRMPQQTISDLADRGAQAADLLIDAFAPDTEGRDSAAWENHKRLRVRTYLSEIHKSMRRLRKALASDTLAYRDVVSRHPPVSYPFPDDITRLKAAELLDRLSAIVDDLEKEGVDLTKKAPRPEPEMRIVPRV